MAFNSVFKGHLIAQIKYVMGPCNDTYRAIAEQQIRT